MKKFLLKSVFLSLVLTVGFCACGKIEVPAANAEKPPLPATVAGKVKLPATNAIDVAAAARHEIELQTSELRGLPFKKPVVYKFMERSALREFLIKKVTEQYSTQELRDYGRSLAAFGLIPDGTDLLAALVSLYDEQIGAFYEPAEHALYTFKDQTWSKGLDRMLLSHELTHALQDQSFDLTTLPLKVKDNDDRVLAASSLLEGDATVLMTQFYAEHADPKNALSDAAAMLKQNTDKLQAAPPYMREMLVFPYVQGQEFVMALEEHGGTAAVDKAFKHLPTSSRDILHPDLYLKRHVPPADVELKPLTNAEWRLIGNNVLGEFGVRSVLEPQVGAFDAQQAAAGWEADRYHVYEHGTNGPTGILWATVWENADEAVEFAETYERFAAKRGVTARLIRNGVRVIVRQSNEPSFFTTTEALVTR